MKTFVLFNEFGSFVGEIESEINLALELAGFSERVDDSNVIDLDHDSPGEISMTYGIELEGSFSQIRKRFEAARTGAQPYQPDDPSLHKLVYKEA